MVCEVEGDVVIGKIYSRDLTTSEANLCGYPLVNSSFLGGNNNEKYKCCSFLFLCDKITALNGSVYFHSFLNSFKFHI